MVVVVILPVSVIVRSPPCLAVCARTRCADELPVWGAQVERQKSRAYSVFLQLPVVVVKHVVEYTIRGIIWKRKQIDRGYTDAKATLERTQVGPPRAVAVAGGVPLMPCPPQDTLRISWDTLRFESGNRARSARRDYVQIAGVLAQLTTPLLVAAVLHGAPPTRFRLPLVTFAPLSPLCCRCSLS